MDNYIQKNMETFEEVKLESKLYFDKDKNTITIRADIGEEDKILIALRRLGVQSK